MRSSRLGYRIGLTGLVVLLSCESLQTAIADGDTRTLTLNHTHRSDTITVTFKRNGRYDDDGLSKINYFLRDWRNDEQTKMDPRLFDLVWEVQNEFGGNKTINIISSYRSPQTNSMLRRRSNGVAKFSQHMLGKAMDFNITGVPLEDLRAAGLRLQRGGVGFYPSSGSPFVHLDVGSVRHWPRMTHDQLAKVFPNGRTVHVPTDGRPLPGYELALADVEKRGNSPSSSVMASAGDTAANGSKFLSKLFGIGKSDDDEDGETTSTSGRANARQPAGKTTVASAESKPLLDSKFGESKLMASKFGDGKLPESKLTESKMAEAKPVPTPAAKPQTAQAAQTAAQPAAGGFQLASAGPSKIVPAPSRPAQAASLVARAATTPNDIIRARGFWEGLPDAAPAPRPVAAAKAPSKFQLASVDKAATAPTPETETTASVTPWPVNGINDRVAPELALSYAATPSPEATTSANLAPMGSGVSRGGALNAAAASAARSTTVAVKGSEQPAPAERGLTERSLAAHAAARFARQDNPTVNVPAAKTTKITMPRMSDPWLRAMMITPDTQRFMSTTLFGMPDFRNLRPLMQKPASAVMMTFANEPNPGLETNRFTGTAVTFVSTVSFSNRTAMVQP